MIVCNVQFQFFDGGNYVIQFQLLKSSIKNLLNWRIVFDANDGEPEFFAAKEVSKELDAFILIRQIHDPQFLEATPDIFNSPIISPGMVYWLK
jgi:hypothetical protein